MRLGVISDTHGLLREAVFTLFQGADCIIHAGDVGGEDVLVQLRALAPVQAVYGNSDVPPLTQKLPGSLSLTVEEIRIFVTHIGGDLPSMASLNPDMEGAHLIICGHTHMPLCQKRDGLVLFNPGSAGPRRFSLPVTAGVIEIRGSEIHTEVREIA